MLATILRWSAYAIVLITLTIRADPEYRWLILLVGFAVVFVAQTLVFISRTASNRKEHKWISK